MTTTFPARGALLLALTLASVANASAPDAGTTHVRTEPAPHITELPPVVVALPPEDAPTAPTRRDPTAAVTVIDVGEEREWSQDAAELLARGSGVRVSDLGGFGQAKALSLRGASPNGVLVLLDGVPLNGAGGIVDLGRLPAAIVDRYEVLRGGAGTRYGSGGLGGALHLTTRAPGDKARAEAEFSFGSFGTARGTVSGSGPVLGGEALAILHGGRSRGDFRYLFNPTPDFSPEGLGFRIRENNQAAQGGALLRYRRAFGANWRGDVLFDALVDERGRPGSAGNPTPDVQDGARRFSGAARATWEKEAHRVHLRTYVRDELTRTRGTGITTLALGGRHRLIGGAVEAGTLFGMHALTAHLELARESFFSNSPVDPAWLRASAMLIDEWLLADGRLTLSPSVRVDQVGPYTLLAPKVGGAMLLPLGFGLRANVGQASRAPSFLELYVPDFGLGVNPELRPERALFVDLGVTHETARTRFALDGFATVYEDLILYEYYPPLAPRPYNFPAAHVFGAELEGALDPRGPLSLSVGYTLLFTENRRDDPRFYKKELPLRPRHTLSARVEAGPRWLRGRLEVLAQSDQFINRTASLSLPARAFLHAGVATELLRDPRLTASFELRNLFDVQAQDFAGYPLPGRAFFLTVTAAWEPASALPPSPL